MSTSGLTAHPPRGKSLYFDFVYGTLPFGFEKEKQSLKSVFRHTVFTSHMKDSPQWIGHNFKGFHILLGTSTSLVYIIRQTMWVE